MCCIYAMEFYSVIKKNEIMSFAGKQMEFEIIMLSEINQTQKVIILSHMWKLGERKEKKNEQFS